MNSNDAPSLRATSDVELDLDALEQVAREATPGPWIATECLDVWVSTEAVSEEFGEEWPVAQCGDHSWQGHKGMTAATMRANGAYVSTFDPPTVLRLIDLARASTGNRKDGSSQKPQPTRAVRTGGGEQ